MIRTAQLRRNLLRVGVRREPTLSANLERTIPRTYTAWGIINVTLSLLITFIPHTASWSTLVRNGMVLSGALWMLIGAMRLRIPIRMNPGMALILLLQIWSVISTFWISGTIGRSRAFNFTDFFLLRYVYVSFNAAMLVYIAPWTRRFFTFVMFTMVFASAIVAFAQFARFMPALRLAQYLNPDQNIMNWDNRGGIRAIGLYGFPGHLAILSVFACSFITGRLAYRRLTRAEVFWFVFFAVSAILPQARSHIPSLGIVCLVFMIGMVIREKGRSSKTLFLFAAAIASLFIFGGSKMNYILSTNWVSDPNLTYRKEQNWFQADIVERAFPWTGIGPEPRYWGRFDIIQDKWAPRTAFDNGWLLVKASYGYIGVIITAAAMMMGVLFPLAVRFRRRESNERKEFAVALGLIAIATSIGMYGNNVVTWEPAMAMLFTTLGMVCLSREEEVEMTKMRPLVAPKPESQPA